MRIKKYLSPAGALNKRYTDKDFEGTGWHYIPRSDIKPDDKLLNTALKLGEEYYLAGEDGYLLPSNIVNDFLKSKGLTTAYDYYYDLLNLSPFTKNLNSYFTLQYDANDRIGQLMKLRAADRKANQLTPGVGTFVVAPVAATLAGIGGATLAPWLTSALATPTGQALMYGSIGGEALNFTSQLGGYDNFGHLIYNAGGGENWKNLPEWQKTLWNFTNPGYLISGPTSKAVNLTTEGLQRAALDNTFKGIPINPTTKDLAKAINESVDKQSLYTSSILHKFDNPYQITKVSGDKIRLRLPSHTQEKPREVVLVPHGNNLYELHIRTWDGDHIPANLNPQEKTALFESVYNELPEGAEILFPESSADYPATRGTVAALTHLSRDPRFQRGNTTGTLIYTDKNGNLQTFTGNSFIKRLTKPAQILQQLHPEQRIYFGYFGPKHSISEVVNSDGTVNVQKAIQIANRAAYEHGGIRLLDRLENPEWHKTDPNTFLHTKEVAQRAWQMPTPAGYTKLDLMFAALGHDFGKMFAGEGHGEIGADYLKLMFPDMTDAQYNAVARHMMSEDVARMLFSDQPLTLATMEADRGGAPLFRDLWKPLDSHLQGEDAVKMFKEYGGEPIPEGSINGEQLRKYVPEARERYGLVGNTDITDEEIAQALYKHVKELGGNTAAVNALGEPLLLFRGDTRAYTELKERMSPEELAEKSGTMDNSLGTLFLGEFPNRFQGADRYIGTWRNFNGSLKLIGSGTGSKVIFDGKTALEIEDAPLIGSKFGGGYKLYSHPMRHGNIEVYKLPASMMESGVNDLNAFVVRTPAVRDATPEISVLNDDWLVQGAVGSKPHMSTKLIYDKDGFPLYQHADGTTTPALAGMDNRPGMAEHYRFVLDDAKNKGEGLLRSNKSAPLRDEHELYTYFALPNFNIRGAKHILPYDLRIPRNWNDSNIYRSVLPFVLGGSALYGITSNRKGGRLIPRKYGIGGYVTDLLGLNKEGSFLTKASSKLGELASKAEKPLSYLNVLSPTSVVGAVGRKIMGNPESIMNLIRKGTGITTSAFSEAHPITSLALNLGLDFVTDPFTLVGSVGKINLAGKIGKAAALVVNKTEMLTHLSKLLTTSAVTPERQRLWKCLMYITNGRPSEGFKLAKTRLSGDELSDILKYVLTGDAQAFSRLKPGYTGFIEKGRKPEVWYERYTTASPSSNKIELTDLTLGIVDSKVNVPALYEQLSKASPLLSKDLAISIRGGEIIGTKQAIKNQGLLKMLNGEDVPLGIIPIVADNYQSGIRALQRLNNETPIMSYSLRTHLIKTAKRGQEGMFNTAGMHCYIYADEKGKLRLVEADIFKNTASGVTKKYSGIFEGSSIKDIGKRIALNRYNGAEQTGVVVLREKRLETNDLINALALLEKRIYEGRSALKRGDITENDFLTLRAETSKTEDLLREMLIQQNPKYYLLNLTEVNLQSRKLIGKPDKKGHWITSEDAHIESTIDKIIETLRSKHELTRLSTDRNRIRKIVTQAMEIGENLSRLKRATFTSLIETPETVNPRLKAMFRTIEPEKYVKASKLNRAKKFSDSPQDNIVFLFSEGKTYVPRTLDFNSKNNIDNQIKNTIYAIQNYSTSDSKSRELITKAIDEGFTLFDPEKMRSPETFYNTLKECKQLFSDKLSELIPNVDKKISSNLHRSQKLISELPNILKREGKINP